MMIGLTAMPLMIGLTAVPTMIGLTAVAHDDWPYCSGP